MPSLRRRQVELTDPHGLHLRAARRFVQVAQPFRARVRVLCGGRAADGKCVVDLMMLVGECDARLDLEVVEPDAAEALDDLSHTLEARSDENRHVEEQQ